MDWMTIQARLGVSADGRPGRMTYAALIERIAGRELPLAGDLGSGLATHGPSYGIDASAMRLAAFLAQTAHESAGFTRTVESLSYSAEGLARTWPSRFAVGGRPGPLALRLAHRPEAIANTVYGGRIGNTGPEDGWRYRGRGLIQITGKDNYRAIGKALGLDLVTHPELAAQPTTAVLVSLEFWHGAHLNELADVEDMEGITRGINGGLTGLVERQALYARAIRVVS